MDFKYIIIRASSALLLLSGPLFTACDDDDPDAFITVSKQEIEVEYNGLTANGETVNFDLGSNHAWQATYVEEWIHPTHTEGDRGRTRIFLAIDENDTGKDREGYVIFEGGGSRRTVAVTQKLKIDALMVSPGKLTVVRSGLLGSTRFTETANMAAGSKGTLPCRAQGCSSSTRRPASPWPFLCPCPPPHRGRSFWNKAVAHGQHPRPLRHLR